MKILILRFSSMGDILLATPVLDTLRIKYTDAVINWVVNAKFSEAIANNPNVNRTITFRSKKDLKNIRKEISLQKYDLIFDLHKNLRSFYLTAGQSNVFRYNKRTYDRFMLVHFKKHYSTIIPATKMYFEALNKAKISTPEDWKLTFNIKKYSDEETVHKYDLNKTKYIVFIPGASYETKVWPKEYFKDTAHKILNESNLSPVRIIIIGRGEAEEKAGRYIAEGFSDNCLDLTGKLDLNQSASVLKHAELVLTNDNGPMHLAECFNRKIIAIFGCTTEELGFFPYSTDYNVIEDKELKCRPCTHFGRRKCPEGHFKCMKDITPEIVFKKVLENL